MENDQMRRTDLVMRRVVIAEVAAELDAQGHFVEVTCDGLVIKIDNCKLVGVI